LTACERERLRSPRRFWHSVRRGGATPRARGRLSAAVRAGRDHSSRHRHQWPTAASRLEGVMSSGLPLCVRSGSPIETALVGGKRAARFGFDESAARVPPQATVAQRADRGVSRRVRENRRRSCLGDRAKARCPYLRRGGCRGRAARASRSKMGNGCSQHREAFRCARTRVPLGSSLCQMARRSAGPKCRDTSSGARFTRDRKSRVRTSARSCAVG
jgi:hypothetical protein